jgi:hypothetical protein
MGDRRTFEDGKQLLGLQDQTTKVESSIERQHLPTGGGYHTGRQNCSINTQQCGGQMADLLEASATYPAFRFPVPGVFPPTLIPLDLLNPSEDLGGLLSRIVITGYEEKVLDPGPGSWFKVDIGVAPEAVFELPGLNGFSLVYGGATGAVVTLGFKILPAGSQLTIKGGVCIRFARELLRPVMQRDGRWLDDPSRQYTELTVSAGVIIDQNRNVKFEGKNEFALSPSMIADTGFVIEGTVAIDLSDSESLPEALAMGLGPEWRGAVFKNVTLHLPDHFELPILPSDLKLINFYIGSGGLSGSVSGNWTPTVTGSQITGSGAGTLFGFPFGLKKLGLTLLQNALTGINVKGVLGLPFFDRVLDVDLGIDLNGHVSLTVDSATGFTDFMLSAGSVDILHVELSSLTVEEQEGVVTVGLGGNFTPHLGGLDWPTFRVQKLSIDSRGNVRLDGGWLNLPDQYSLDFHGFKLEITKLGFGKTEDGGKWIGFSGGLKLVDGLRAGASVEGLRIIWYDDPKRSPRVTLNGVGVEFEVPKVLRFQGAVAYRELPGNVHRFDGQIKLELLALDLKIDGTLVVGSAPGYTFFAIYLDAELPAGIPLFSTGLALYGMAGLFAQACQRGMVRDRAGPGLVPPRPGRCDRPGEKMDQPRGQPRARRGSDPRHRGR